MLRNATERGAHRTGRNITVRISRRVELMPHRGKRLLRHPRAAVLYSGRFFGNITRAWFSNHLEYLIRPNDASVFIVVDPSNWCHATSGALVAYREGRTQDLQEELNKQVTAAFDGWQKVYAAVLPDDDTEWPKAIDVLYKDARTQLNLPYSNFEETQLLTWFRQFRHFARANIPLLA